MGTQNADDQEVFEIVDFTTASEWECFIAAVVEAVHEWRLSGERQLSPLSKGQLATAKWSERTVEVKFAEFPFKMTHHCIISETVESPPDESEPSTEYETEEETEKWPQALDDIMNRENDFPARAHCLVRWYGLREFVTLSPSNANQPIICPSKSKLLLSSLTIAANNTNCQVPMFVYVLPPSEKMYLGVGLGSGVRTDYDMIHMRHPPRQCTHLSGLLDVFRSKLKCNETSPPVLVSVRFTYILSEWPHTLWTQQPPDFDATLTDVGFSDLGKLPFGALSDPVSELHLSATWPCVSEDVLVDSDVYSDLDPGSAPLWTARLVTNASPPCLLSEYLTEFLHVCRNNQSVTQILGPDFTPEVEDAAEFSSALDRLTEPSVPTLSKIVGRVRPGSKNVKHSSSQPGEMGPISVDILVPILNYLFPDAEGEEQSAPFPSTLSQVPEWTGEDAPAGEHPLKALLSNMKSSGVDGLVWRLAIVLCHVIHSLGGLPAAAHIWHEVVLELRFRWDNAILVPGIGSGSPDLASTLLHQKLQMLNCCIIRRRAREQSLSKSSKLHNGDSSEEEENWKNSCDTGTSLPISEEVSVGSNESFADALGYHSSDFEDAKDDELSETCSNSSTANTVGSIDASVPDAVLHHSSGCKDLRFTAGTLFESFIIGILNKCFKIIGKYSSSKWESNELYVEEVITSFSDDTEVSVGTSEERIANVQINKCQGTEDHILEEINVSLNGNPKSCLNSCGKSLPDYSTEQGNDEVDEEDEFYECEEEMEEEEKSNGTRSSWDKPEGRLKRCGKLRLIKTNEQLFVPFTQEPAPMTEDRLEEHADVLLRLGTDTVGSQLRARMMSASLLSDMESFKAANPGAVLEDFVRWYSPRDWIEEESDDPSHPPQGSLSARMQIPGNMWKEVWNSAKPVPARRQKRLFDDTREAEQVLHWLASMGPGGVCGHLQPTILHASLCRLAEERALFSLPAPNSLPQPCHSNTLATVLEMIAQRVVRLSRQPPDSNKYQEVVEQIAEVETCIARAQSVRHKLLGDSSESHTTSKPLEDLVLRLLNSPEVILDGGSRGSAAAVIRKLFQQARRASMMVDDSPQESPSNHNDRRASMNSGHAGTASELGRPAGREYLLRTLVPAPMAYSRPVPHRMFAVLLQNEFRLAGAYSQDTTFC